MNSIVNVTLEDIWPGDIILARRPGAYCGTPHRFVDTRSGHSDGVVVVKVASLEGDNEFEVLAMDGWSTAVERLG